MAPARAGAVRRGRRGAGTPRGRYATALVRSRRRGVVADPVPAHGRPTPGLVGAIAAGERRGDPRSAETGTGERDLVLRAWPDTANNHLTPDRHPAARRTDPDRALRRRHSSARRHAGR